jgi:predicted DNA-binding transcriptional regulator AlpA
VAKKTVKAHKPRARKATAEQLCLKGKQVEQIFGLPYRTIYDLHLRGLLPAVRLNRSLWFLRSDIEALIAKSREVSV